MGASRVLPGGPVLWWDMGRFCGRHSGWRWPAADAVGRLRNAPPPDHDYPARGAAAFGAIGYLQPNAEPYLSGRCADSSGVDPAVGCGLVAALGADLCVDHRKALCRARRKPHAPHLPHGICPLLRKDATLGLSRCDIPGIETG